MNLSELVVQARGIEPPMGNQKGKCVFCGIETEHGHEPAFGDSFCNAPLLSGGSVICPACQHMQTSEIPGAKQSAGKLYRSNAWYASEKGIGVIRFPKKEKKEGEEQLVARDLSSVFPLPERTPRSILLEPPEPPFVISLTRSYKKPTWQALMRLNSGVATSRGHFPVGCDYDCIYIDAVKLREDLSIIDRLRTDPSKPGKMDARSDTMIDAEVCQWLDEARATGRVIDADCLEAMLIPWGSDCCHGCEQYDGGISITAHGFCPVWQRRVSPHWFCEKWEQD